MRKHRSDILLPAYCDKKGRVYEAEGYFPAFRSGRRTLPADPAELIPLPDGTLLFSLPDRTPVFYESSQGSPVNVPVIGNRRVWAASAFLSSGYLRTYLPAFEREKGCRPLSLWAYAGLVIREGKFFVPALRIDEDPRSDPALHENEPELKRAIKGMKGRYPGNRLVEQLSHCATEYRCLCARNFFLGRYEAPVPTTPQCNAFCAGCLSRQEGSGFSQSQNRLDFMPGPGEIAEVISHHLEAVDASVASFGQGCEGEPLLRGKDLAKAIALVREKTGRGTIHLNTNGSLPGMVRLLIQAGLDSIRISLNSPTPDYYLRYYQPKVYEFSDVLRSLEIALEAGIFVSLNLFFLPGFTDMETEAEALFEFLRRYPVHMLQTRNLNIDPDYYLDHIGFRESPALGIRKLLDILRTEFPHMRLGYYNPPRESFPESCQAKK